MLDYYHSYFAEHADCWEKTKDLTGQREKKKDLPTNKSNSAFFPCIVLNVKYLWVYDNVFAGIYCSGCIL